MCHKGCGLVLGIILLIWAIWQNVLGISTKWVTIIAAVVLLICSIMHRHSDYCTTEKPARKTARRARRKRR